MKLICEICGYETDSPVICDCPWCGEWLSRPITMRELSGQFDAHHPLVTAHGILKDYLGACVLVIHEINHNPESVISEKGITEFKFFHFGLCSVGVGSG